MVKLLLALLCILLVITGMTLWYVRRSPDLFSSGAPPYGEPESAAPAVGSLAWLAAWERPVGPARVGLQVGHWKNDELPEELSRLIGNTGAVGGGKTEAEVNLVIAQEAAKLLQEKGITVDILPATVPKQYWADVFVAIHADGSTDPATSGFKIAPPWRDYSGSAGQLVTHLETAYAAATDLKQDPNTTRNMRGYYAFAWWRYEYAMHPMTTAAIVETGFLTSPSDRRLIVDNPRRSAAAIAEGITNYLTEKELL